MPVEAAAVVMLVVQVARVVQAAVVQAGILLMVVLQVLPIWAAAEVAAVG
jgi:hypothetical protein